MKSKVRKRQALQHKDDEKRAKPLFGLVHSDVPVSALNSFPVGRFPVLKFEIPIRNLGNCNVTLSSYELADFANPNVLDEPTDKKVRINVQAANGDTYTTTVDRDGKGPSRFMKDMMARRAGFYETTHIDLMPKTRSRLIQKLDQLVSQALKN